MEAVVQVYPRDDFHLELKFDTGAARLFDMRPYLDGGVFQKLKDTAQFRLAYDPTLTPASNTPLGKLHGARHSAMLPKPVCI